MSFNDDKERKVHYSPSPRNRSQWEHKGDHNEGRGSAWTAGDAEAKWRDLDEAETKKLEDADKEEEKEDKE